LTRRTDTVSVLVLHLLSGSNKKAQGTWYCYKSCCAFTCPASHRGP